MYVWIRTGMKFCNLGESTTCLTPPLFVVPFSTDPSLPLLCRTRTPRAPPHPTGPPLPLAIFSLPCALRLVLSPPLPPLPSLSPFYVVEVIRGRVEQPVPMPLPVRRLYPLVLPQQSYVLRPSAPTPTPTPTSTRS